MKVKVVAYKNRIVIVPDKPEEGAGKKDPTWYPTGGPKGNHLGCVISPTETQLGVSQEAIDLMERIERNHDAIGDISWWERNDGNHAFAWWGPIYRIINPESAQADREWNLKPSIINSCTIIPNDVPDEAKAVLDAEEDPVFWKQPFTIEYEAEQN